MANTTDFKGKWALVTGASAGIGAAMARELAGHGAKLILTARRKDRLEELAQELSARGTEVRIVAADLRDPDAPRQIYEATVGAGIPVDILINNAGLGQFGVFTQSPIEQELAQIRVNCEAMVHLARLFVPHMVERRSRLGAHRRVYRELSADPVSQHLRGHQGVRPLLFAGAY